MKQLQGGLHEGEELRAERVDGCWRAQALLRDVAYPVDPDSHTGLYEYHRDGVWTDIGSYRTLRLAEVALSMLKEATHLVRGAHRVGGEAGTFGLPARLVTHEEARRTLIEFGLVEDPEDYASPGAP